MSKKECNICGGEDFNDFRGRKLAECRDCKSLERHRLVRWTLESLGYFSEITEIENLLRQDKRVFQLAPERPTFRYMYEKYSAAYTCADLNPSRYRHAQCLKISLPEGFSIFPDNYFDLILHNHVLEHIPGDYQEHLQSFLRILRPGGHMVFTIPPLSKEQLTVQYGEDLISDEERTKLHGQKDHYKTFGYDFLDWFNQEECMIVEMKIPDEIRSRINAPSGPVWVCSKSSLSDEN